LDESTHPNAGRQFLFEAFSLNAIYTEFHHSRLKSALSLPLIVVIRFIIYFTVSSFNEEDIEKQRLTTSANFLLSLGQSSCQGITQSTTSSACPCRR
jgi:hypothetical protein